MAAKNEDLLYFKKLWTELNCLQNGLLEEIEILKKRRDVVEDHCGRCQKLFKPWPVKVYQECSSIEVDEERIQTANEPESREDSEDEKEKQELAMLDEILVKAQQARHFQTKLSKPKKKTSSSSLKTVVSTSGTKVKVSQSKVAYPVVTRPPSAKSTYSASYKGVSKTKQFNAGSRKSSGISSQAHPKTLDENKMNTTTHTPAQIQQLGKPQNIAKPTVRENEAVSCSKKSNPPAEKTTLLHQDKVDILVPTKETTNLTKDTKFLLSEKGPSLEIPHHFEKLCKKHRRLINQIQSLQKLENYNNDDFAKQVEEMFCSELSGYSGKALYMRCNILEKSYEKLLCLAKESMSILQAEAQRSESGSQAVVIWECVTLKYKEFEKEFHSLVKDLECCGNYCPCSEYHLGNSEDFGSSVISKCQGGNLTSISSSLSTKSNFCYPTNNDGVFTYLNSKEFKLLQKLGHDLKMKKFQLEFQRTVSENILPLLRELPSNHRFFLALFRTVYSVLCCDSRTFPTMVQDAFPDDNLL